MRGPPVSTIEYISLAWTDDADDGFLSFAEEKKKDKKRRERIMAKPSSASSAARMLFVNNRLCADDHRAAVVSIVSRYYAARTRNGFAPSLVSGISRSCAV